jgi:hypothetical protein
MDSHVLDKKPRLATFIQVVTLGLLLSGLAVGVKNYVGELTGIPHLEQPQRLS